ncbi:cell division cycle and apoptosis regulator 1 isoform X1 [Labeo rohita]|uniref:Cell division cycle and apoptosis regulator protein 1 n=1 Tax=Labeo rohita TaxID=84645 RepID=A0A498MWI7_LABRO|nr:cell division cycle and apoptosis regulator 1 isoform X1 [Labeo rohita]
MAQFGGQKNPPWAAQFAATAVSQPGHSGQSLDLNSLHSLGVQQPSLLGASPMYTQQSALAAASLNTQSAANYQLSQQTAALQQQAAAAAAAALQQLPQPQQALLSQPPVALPTSLSLSNPQQTAQITVSYPTPRSSHQQQTQPQKQRVFTGVVSKLHDTFGFVDEDGKTPQVGDRVLVEAVYNPNMPFKWNAQRIQTLPQLPNQTSQPPGPNMMKPGPTMLQSLPPPTTFSVPAQGPPPSLLQAQLSAASLAPLLQNPPQPLLPQPPPKDSVFSGGLLQPPVRMMPQPQQVRRVDPSPRFPSRSDRPELILRKDDRSRERDRERRRSRERSPTRKRSRDRSPRRERSPRRPRRVVPRYTVQFSKFSLDGYNCDMMELRRRYQSLYIPSDFFDAVFTWVDAFPLIRPFTFGNYCNFHIMHKEVDSLVKNTAVLDPPDANHTYSAKVMLLANPSLDELYHKSCALAEDPQELRDSFQHPARLIKFLVGMRGKDEAMAIGGHWSPSLDGADPENDASVLIKTAIRCCKALTGIDLSLCTQWYRFAEIRYHRPEETHKGRTVPAHVETVVLFLPDVWHCLPTRSEWEGLSRGLKEQLAEKLLAERKEADGEQALNANPSLLISASHRHRNRQTKHSESTERNRQEEEDKDEDDSKEVTTPTHWSKLDPKSMKVNDLRKELESRSLSSKGLKSQLIARLTKQLKVEEQVEESKEPEKPEPPSVEEDESCRLEDDREEEERKRQEEQERQRRERRYVLPDEPTIIVHPNWAAKNGKFDCSIMSLSVLLDYRLEDNKEHSFEVSLFAELFNEMLQRDFGYRIYKALASLPNKDERKDKKEKAKKEADRRDDEDKERGIKREESKDDDDNEDGSSNNNADEYDPLEAEDADDYDDDDKDDEDSNGRDRRDDRRDERKSKERSSKDKDEKKKQMVTFNKDLLMAFVYFDQSHCGYLLEKDLEEIMYTLGLHLSRAQLTDRPKDEPSPTLTSDALVDNLLGNHSLLPSLKIKRESEDSGESSSLIVYKGAMVDVGSMMQKLEKSEKTREEIEQKLMHQDIKMEEDSKHIAELEAANRTLQRELEEVKSNLRETEDNLRASDQQKGSYEQQLHSTVSSLDTIMKELQGVLSHGDPTEDGDQKTQANGSDE